MFKSVKDYFKEIHTQAKEMRELGDDSDTWKRLITFITRIEKKLGREYTSKEIIKYIEADREIHYKK